jgi:hypothetical protein
LDYFILDNIKIFILGITAYGLAQVIGDYFKSERAVEVTAAAIEDVPEDNSCKNCPRLVEKTGFKYKNKKWSVCGWS